MKNACSPQAVAFIISSAQKPMGGEKYPAMQHNSGAFYPTVYLDLSNTEKCFLSVTSQPVLDFIDTTNQAGII